MSRASSKAKQLQKEAAARRMLADGTLSMEQITDFTGLNLKQIEELKVWGHMLNFLKLQLKSAVGRKSKVLNLICRLDNYKSQSACF